MALSAVKHEIGSIAERASPADILRKERDRFVALAFCRADMLFELEDSGNVLFAAGATPGLLGRAPDALSGVAFIDLIAEGDRSMASDLLAAAGRKGRIEDFPVRLKGDGAKAFPVLISGYQVADFDNHFFLAIKVKTPASSAAPDQTLVRDKTTGLLDQSAFGAIAAERAMAFQRAGGQPKMSLVKVENLNFVTEKLDASKKKELLNSIASVLKKNSIGETAAQLDGENFGFLHDGDADVEAVSHAIDGTARDISPEGSKVTSRSMTIDAGGEAMGEDQMARAIIFTMQNFCKKKGDLRTASLSDALDGLLTDTVEAINYIKGVSQTRQINLVYMPISNLRSKQVHHFEVLTRFKVTTYGESPYHLITLAEEVGCVTDFDFAVCQKTIEQLSAYDAKSPIPPVAVNLSGSSISNPAFVERLLDLLDRTPKLSRSLLFEITESAEIEDLVRVNTIIQEFRKRKYKMCLDDFGAGAASFEYLNMLDVDIIKFDGPVVKRAAASEKGKEMLSALSDMCRKLGYETVAEMVEDKKMANLAYDCGIDFGQGYYFGKPEGDPYKFAMLFA